LIILNNGYCYMQDLKKKYNVFMKMQQ